MRSANSTFVAVMAALAAMAFLAPAVTAQQPHQAEAFTLGGTLDPSQSHDYAANRYIDLTPGFLSQPLAGTHTDMGIDPYYNVPTGYGLPESQPPDHDIVGRLGFYPMDFRVNERGAATISIPLEFPEGVNGMTPHLSLEYDSQAGNGIMGLGWSLGGMSKISRTPYAYKYDDGCHSVEFSNDDQLSLDGNLLKKGTFQGMECYYPEIYDYSVVLPITGGYKVLKRDGNTYTYTSRYYLQHAITEPIEWHLTKVEDPYGNRIEYEYRNDRDEGAFYPVSVSYTGRDGADPAYRIVFVYDEYDQRPDCPKKWFSQPGEANARSGFSRVTRKLFALECMCGEVKTMSYRLTYTTLDWSTRALAYVERSHFRQTAERRGYNTVIPLKFGWSRMRHQLQYEQAGEPVYLSPYYTDDRPWRQAFVFAARLESDNVSHQQKHECDIVHLMTHDVNNTPKYHLSVFRAQNAIVESGQAYFYDHAANVYNCNTANTALNDGRAVHALFPADTDGDGLDEIVCVHTYGGTLGVSLLKPNGTDTIQLSTVYTSSSASSHDLGSFQAGDLNGDGLSDLLFVVGDHLHALMSAPGTPFSIPVSSGTSISGQRRIVVADFNGDMRDQALVLIKNGNSFAARLFRVEKDGDSGHVIPSPASATGAMAVTYFSSFRNRLCCGDFNGDGKKDILLMCTGAWRLHFSKGKGLFTDAWLVEDPDITGDSFAIASEDGTGDRSFAIVADLDHDGCDDVSLTLTQDFERPSSLPNHNDTYRGAFRRDFLIRPTSDAVQVRKVRNLRTWWQDGNLVAEDRCIDSIVLNTTAYSTVKPFIPVMGNHKGTSPNEVLYCRMDEGTSPGTIQARLNNTGNFLPDSLTRAITMIVGTLGETTSLKYIPVSFQKPIDETLGKKEGTPRSLVPVLPFNGFLSVVEEVSEEVKDDGASASDGKSFRTTRFHFLRPLVHTRGRGLLGFLTVWSRRQGQSPTDDLFSVNSSALDATRHLMVPASLLVKRFRENGQGLMAPLVTADYTYTFQDHTDFADALGQIPEGVFSPFLSETVTARNDGSPQRFGKNVTVRDGYGNVTSEKRSYGANANSYPFLEVTATSHDNAVSAERWVLGVPESLTVTRKLTGSDAEKVVRNTVFQNDMAHGRHLSMTTEPDSGKPLTETYGYDAFGNLHTVTSDIGDGHPRTETYNHSMDGRFLTSHANALGHVTSYWWDPAFALLDSVTDPNGLTTRYRYDFLCDLVETEHPSGVREDRRMKWVDTCSQYHDTWHPDTPGFGSPVYLSWSKRSGDREAFVFYDQHRRKLREVTATMDGRKVYVDYRYHDVTGLPTAVSSPYHPDDETPRFTRHAYDCLDRPVRTDRPDGAYESHSYDGATETVRGFDGQRRTLSHNPAGLVTKVSDYGDSGGAPVDIDYARYGDGLLKTAMVAGDNTTLAAYTYDANRHPASVSDPSLGLVTYQYNAYGELTHTVTPRNESLCSYDALGRMVSRVDSDGTSSWTYDVGHVGQLHNSVYAPMAGPTVTEWLSYDQLGRLTGQTQQVGAFEEWAFLYGYDALGRRNTVTYPSGRRFKWHYDNNGFMDRVSDAETGAAVWQATATDRWGNVTDFTGGGIHVLRDYNDVTGLVEGISARKDGRSLFGQACSWSSTGNLEWRTDTTLNLRETFAYDRFNRLVSAYAKSLSGTVTHASQGVQFDGKGNVTGKDGVGGFAYGGTNPYAVTALGPDNAVAGILTDQSVAYTPFDKVRSVTQNGRTLTVDYGIDRQRVVQTIDDGNSRRAKRHFTPLYETVTENGVTKKLHYLTSATGLFAIFVGTSNNGGIMYHTIKDHQGSLAATVHGNTVERLSYDPWGRRRNTTDFGYGNVSHTFDRGYTLHEHYDGFDLINMNGRLYDPILGRMLSPDIVVQDEQNSQAYNRYSYCFNNPLRFTDPSGYVVRGTRNYYDWSSRVYYDFGSYRSNGSAFNTDMSEGKFSPVYDVNGVLLGTTKEGFTGQVLLYGGSEDIDFSSLSESDALLIEGVSTYDQLSDILTGETKSNIWTNIVSQLEGTRVYDEVFHMSDLRENKIVFNPTISASWSSSYALKTGEGKIQGSNKYLYETTVENIQSSIVVHEYYSHIKKNNGNNYRSHRLAYKNVINYKPLWNKTTDAYKGFVVRQLLKYTLEETGRTKVDLPYRYSYNKYKDYY